MPSRARRCSWQPQTTRQRCAAAPAHVTRPPTCWRIPTASTGARHVRMRMCMRVRVHLRVHLRLRVDVIVALCVTVTVTATVGVDVDVESPSSSSLRPHACACACGMLDCRCMPCCHQCPRAHAWSAMTPTPPVRRRTLSGSQTWACMWMWMWMWTDSRASQRRWTHGSRRRVVFVFVFVPAWDRARGQCLAHSSASAPVAACRPSRRLVRHGHVRRLHVRVRWYCHCRCHGHCDGGPRRRRQ